MSAETEALDFLEKEAVRHWYPGHNMSDLEHMTYAKEQVDIIRKALEKGEQYRVAHEVQTEVLAQRHTMELAIYEKGKSVAVEDLAVEWGCQYTGPGGYTRVRAFGIEEDDRHRAQNWAFSHGDGVVVKRHTVGPWTPA